MKIAFIRTATTGVTDADEILELHIAVWEDGKILAQYESKFMPIGACHPGAAKANGFNLQGWSGAPTFRESHAREIQGVLNQADVFGGADLDFHKGMLERQFQRVRTELKMTSKRSVDVQSLAIPLVFAERAETTMLHHLMQTFGLGERSSVKADNEATIKIFEKLVGAFYDAAEQV